MDLRHLKLNHRTLNHRERAILRAIENGRAELSAGPAPALLVDGLPCCHQITVHALAKAGFFPTSPGPARLTERGRHALGLCSVGYPAEIDSSPIAA